MKLKLAFAGALSLSAFGMVYGMLACSSSEAPSGTTTAGKWPERPEGAAAAGSEVRTFALKTLSLGGDDAWKNIGYNLDGKVSTKTANDVCKPKIPGIMADGKDGIDNSFGQNLISLLNTALGSSSGGNVESSVNKTVAEGNFTLLFQAKGLPADGASATGVTGQVFIGAPFGSVPSFSKNDDWPVRKDFTENGTADSSKVKFTNAYVNKGVFVSGDPSTIALTLTVSGVGLTLNIQRAVVTWKTSGAGLAEGVVAGIISADDVVKQIKELAPKLSSQACNGAADKTIETVGNYADILLDGTTDGSRTCDGISIGLGFTAAEVKNPTKVVDPVSTATDPCKAPSDAGTD
ncbi:MAG: hypothetical protein U0174_21320 [Polyangiaceae bacterium]